MSLKTTAHALLFLTLAGTAGAALAGPAADSANQHFKAIATGDLDQLLGGYAKDATLQWIGGPLDGMYSGDARLREVWSKFAAAQGRLDVQVGNLQEAATPRARP
jgi:ketosteroid isomerase-like protein